MFELKHRLPVFERQQTGSIGAEVHVTPPLPGCGTSI
jgi:hypothetical protein